MKPVKNLVFAALLVFTITLNTFAGDVQVPGVVPTPTPTPEERMIAATDATIADATDSQQTTVETADYLFFEILIALLSVY
ncbi:MAG TPA: hypothetical protein VLB46_02605 [Pyrinomonadaceae bacterium]|nr:hypothetical protein [Pyrinomonadaceae bacterium]